MDTEEPRRVALKVAVGHLCMEKGFTAIHETCLETLVELLACYLSELGKSTKAYAELAQRNSPIVSDFVLACADLAILTIPQKPPQVLEIGKKRQHPISILSFYPPFPDPHTYINTLTEPRHSYDYKTVRELISLQRRNIELALTKYISKTRDTECIFADDPYAYPLIANCVKPACYRAVLIPKADESLSHELKDPNLLIKEKKKQHLSKLNNDEDSTNQELPIDNPYLREIKMPRMKNTKSKW